MNVLIKADYIINLEKKECDLITIPFKRPIKAIYVKMVLKAITGE